MCKFRFTLSHILFWIGIITSALAIENIGFLTQGSNGQLPFPYFLALSSIAIASYIGLFFFELKYNRRKFDFVILMPLLLIFVAALVSSQTLSTILFANRETSRSLLINVSTQDKTTGLVVAILFVLTLYSVLRIFPKLIVTSRRMIFIYVAFILVCYLVAIYSLATEHPIYNEILKGEPKSKQIQSFFLNPNMFAGTLLVGIAASIVLNIYKKNAFSYISIVFFFAITMFTGSVISIAVEAGLLGLYFLFETIYGLRYHLVLSIIWLVIYLAAIAGFTVLYLEALKDTMGSFSKLIIYVNKEIYGVDLSSFSHRTEIWRGVIELLKTNPIRFVYGFSSNLSSRVLNGYIDIMMNEPGTTIASTHSGPIQILLNYGILGCLAYLFLLGYFVFCVFKLIKKTTRYSAIYLLVAICLLVYSTGESAFMFNCNVQGLYIGMLFFLPVMMRRQIERHSTLVEEAAQSKYLETTLDKKRFSCRSLVSAGVMLLVAFLVGMTTKNIKTTDQFLTSFIIISINLALLLLATPFINRLFNNGSTKIRHKLFVGLILLISAAVYGGLVYAFVTNVVLSQTLTAILPICLVFILAIGVICFLLFSEEKKEALKDYTKCFPAPLLVGFITFLVCSFINIFMQESFTIYPLYYVVLLALVIVVYTFVYGVIGTKTIKQSLRYYSLCEQKAINKSIEIENKKEAIWRRESK